MTSARSVWFPAPGQIEFAAQDVREPRAGEIRCTATRSLISIGTELACLGGQFDDRTFWEEWVSYPFQPGYSMVSIIDAVGTNTSAKMGQRVFTFTPHASQFVCAEADATLIPDAVSDTTAAWSSLAVTTQWAMRRSAFVFGESAAVVGLGPLGQLLVQYLRLAGARRIVVIDTDARRLELAAALGATDTILGAVADHAVVLRGSFDVVFDATGHPAVLAPASELVRPLGRLVLVGDAPRPRQQPLGPRIVADGISVIGVHAGTANPVPSPADPWSTSAMLDVFYAYVLDGRIQLEDLTTDLVRPDDIVSTYRALQHERQPHLGVFIDWSTP